MLKKAVKEELGFTLMEMLCVVFLIGLTIMIAAPALQDFGQKRSLEIGARTIATEMRKTQQRAITAGHGQIIEFRPGNRIRITDGKTEEKYYVDLPEGVSFRAITFPKSGNVHFLRFNYNGSPSSGGTVSLTNSSGDVRYVIVAPVTGRVRISEDPPEHWET